MSFGVFARRLRLITGMFFFGLGLPPGAKLRGHSVLGPVITWEGYTDHVWTFRELLTVKFKPLDSQSISR